MSRVLPPLAAGVALLLGTAAAAPAAPDRVRFNRDIRPIMSDTCFHCHGFDPKTREAGLRLDIREEALKPTKNDVLPIVPGKPEESEIIARIFATDKEDIMPPPKAHKDLTTAQKETFKRWVAEGAEYEAHWAYAPLTKPAPPANGAANPIDAFILAKLQEKGISPSPEAPRGRLLRRLSLDLTGLPPTPEETAAFAQDPSPDAYEKQVDRLLASPRYGERMAVWWLDIARFTDTVGFHGDQNQRIFPYRDYVINSFNGNKGFDQFTIEQLAGDLLPNPTPEQLVATGYNRLNMMTREGGAQPREYLAKYGAERVRSVAAAWFGSTFGCAECHDHKFDPIKTADFYSLQSFFADMKQWGVYADYGYTRNPDLAGYNNEYPFPPEVQVESPYLQARKKEREAELQAAMTQAAQRLAAEAKMQSAFRDWSEEVAAFRRDNPTGWKTLPPDAEPGNQLDPVPDAKRPAETPKSSGKKKAAAPTETARLRPGVGHVAALQITAAREKEGAKTAALKPEIGIIGADGKERKVGIYFADATAKVPQYNAGEDLLGVTGGWVLPKTAGGQEEKSVWLLDPPQMLGEEETLVVKTAVDPGLMLTFAVSPLAALHPLEAAAAPLEPKLGAQWLLSAAADREAFDQYKTLSQAVRETREGRAWSLITEATTPMTIRVLPRGNWQDDSGAIVLPSTPSFLPGRLESTFEHRLTRLDLARWLCSPANPITARAVTNRLWQQFFGIGLSAAVDDLGSQGELPSHPELLDWLASDFREHGWDFKRLIRQMVTSRTYRQSSSLRPELREIDPANRLLASQNPRRLEAEFVRDNALFIAGVLNTADIGGPSVKPYQPKGYYEALQFPSRDYIPSTGPEQWRRGVYMHWQRTFLHPMLANFDAPARDECAALRTVSNTPQQALTLLNDPEFVEASRLFAGRLLSAPGVSDAERIRQGLELATAREPKPKEAESLESFLGQQREYYRAHLDDAAKLLATGTAKPVAADAAEGAAWTTLCRVLLNLQETITRY